MRDWPLLSLLRSLAWEAPQPDLVSPRPLCLVNNVSPLSRILGLDRLFHRKLLGLLDLGYKCRLQLPLFVSAGFFLCHLLSNFVPRVEINVQVVGDEQDDDEEEGEEGDHDEEDDDDNEEEEERGDDGEVVGEEDRGGGGDAELVEALQVDVDLYDAHQGGPREGGVHVEIVGQLRLS